MKRPSVPLQAASVTVATAMGVEAWAVRRRVPGVALVRTGIGMRGFAGSVRTPLILSLGLAGGLRPDLPPGVVIVADRIALEDGELMECDPEWTRALAAATRRLGYPCLVGPVVTATHLVTGVERGVWAERGFMAVDMESAHLVEHASAVAAVRVILDTPLRELSSQWEQPLRAARDPRNLAETLWLVRNAPRFALRAANVLAEALREDVHAEV